MNKIISFSEYREIYIAPSQKNYDPEDFYDNDDNPDWDFFVNTEALPNSNQTQNENIKNYIVKDVIIEDINNINDSYTDDSQIESLSLHLNFNSYIKILVPFAILFFLY
jgi:hypothetical protein